MARPRVPKEGASVVRWNDHLVMFGGRTEGNEKINDIWRINPEAHEAVPLAVKGKTPEGREFHTAHVYQDLMYVIHGSVKRPSSSFRYKLPALDLAKRQWRCFPTTGNAPEPLCHHASALLGPTVFVTGGLVYKKPPPDNFSQSSDQEEHAHPPCMYELSLESLIWSEVDVKPGPRYWGHSSGIVNGALYLFGGQALAPDEEGQYQESDVMWRYHFVERTWAPVQCGFRALADFTPEADDVEGKLALAKGDEIEILSESLNRWTKGRSVATGKLGWYPSSYVALSPMSENAPPARTMHASIATSEGILVWGGVYGDVTNLNDCWYFDASAERWHSVSPTNVPPNVTAQQAAWLNGVVHHPCLHLGKLFSWNPGPGTWQQQPLAVSKRSVAGAGGPQPHDGSSSYGHRAASSVSVQPQPGQQNVIVYVVPPGSPVPAGIGGRNSPALPHHATPLYSGRPALPPQEPRQLAHKRGGAAALKLSPDQWNGRFSDGAPHAADPSYPPDRTPPPHGGRLTPRGVGLPGGPRGVKDDWATPPTTDGFHTRSPPHPPASPAQTFGDLESGSRGGGAWANSPGVTPVTCSIELQAGVLNALPTSLESKRRASQRSAFDPVQKGHAVVAAQAAELSQPPPPLVCPSPAMSPRALMGSRGDCGIRTTSSAHSPRYESESWRCSAHGGRGGEPQGPSACPLCALGQARDSPRRSVLTAHVASPLIGGPGQGQAKAGSPNAYTPDRRASRVVARAMLRRTSMSPPPPLTATPRAIR
ncbi:Actin-fragmin kinase [Diplonema papillatum]|nr:Actin-fragmin kinase [Diplonema papillatum]